LDFELDGETTARLKARITTCGIPVIALAKMAAVRDRGHISQNARPRYHDRTDGKADEPDAGVGEAWRTHLAVSTRSERT